MNYIDNIKLKMVVDNDTEVHIRDAILNNIEIIYNTDPYTNNECLITFSMPTEYYSFLELVSDLNSDTKLSAKRFIQYINAIRNEEYIDCIIKLLNKYKRADLIAILLDKNKNVKSFGDFEL